MKYLDQLGDRELLLTIQVSILANPDAGDLIPGSGGVRKMRVADASRSKGKRGGYRVLYFDLPDLQLTYLLMIYGKGEKDNLTSDELKQIRQIAKLLKEAR